MIHQKVKNHNTVCSLQDVANIMHVMINYRDLLTFFQDKIIF
jgi:hypothetical protein